MNIQAQIERDKLYPGGSKKDLMVPFNELVRISDKKRKKYRRMQFRLYSDGTMDQTGEYKKVSLEYANGVYSVRDENRKIIYQFLE